MHILITDSGVGGLSVVAYAEQLVREHGFAEPVRLTFANAAPENDYGYNSMPTRAEKLETFDRFLRSVTKRFAPDMVYVACNTLSVLLPDTPYFQSAALPVKGIVGTAVGGMLRELQADPASVVIIFGTPTTIDAGTYPRLLSDAGVDPSRIVVQACPGLADTISEDREGIRTKAEILGWTRTAIEKMQERTAPVVAALACTHYGYRKPFFTAAFQEEHIRASVIDPNERATDDIFGREPESRSHEVTVEVVTRYPIPPETVDALTWFLSDTSPTTVGAMQNFVHLPDLF